MPDYTGFRPCNTDYLPPLPDSLTWYQRLYFGIDYESVCEYNSKPYLPKKNYIYMTITNHVFS